MSIYKYIKSCEKCSDTFKAKSSREKNCPKHKLKNKIKRKKPRISIQEKKQIYLRDNFICRISRKDLRENPRDCCCVKIKASNYYITVSRACIRLAKRLRIEELSQFG